MAVKKIPPIKIALLFGTRPEAIKLAPVIRRLQASPEWFKPVVMVTAQHREMLDQVLQVMHIRPDVDLDLMRPKQTLARLTADALCACEAALKRLQPDLVLVQGDTATTLAGSLAAFYLHIPVGHVEAGLRTHDLANPFPEELNRQMVSKIANWHFAATQGAQRNLLAEDVPGSRIFITGNPVVDALVEVYQKDFDLDRLGLKLPSRNPRLVLMTAHRRENFGKPLAEICRAIKILSGKFPGIHFIFPVHRNPEVRRVVQAILGSAKGNLHCVPPLPYTEFINLLARSELVLTDSGGIQEEAPVFGVPTLILRKVTERPEALAAGARLLDLDCRRIVEAAGPILSHGPAPRRKTRCPFGDGQAADRIARAIAWIYGLAKMRPRNFQP